MEKEVSPLERRLVDALVPLAFGRPRRGGPWTPAAPHREVTIPSANGAMLAGLWFSAERPRGAVVLAHPDRRYGRHWFAREGWVDHLLAHGLDVLTFDFPGYGASRGPPTYHHEHVVSAARVARHWAGGFPVHVAGVSLGAFAVANAAPRLGFVESLVLESPYPSFNAWYGGGAAGAVMGLFDRLFPTTSASIQADRNLARAGAKRILVALAEEDDVTPPALTEAVHRAAPRATLLRVPGAKHLEPFARSPAYREAILDTLLPGRRRAAGETAIAAGAPVAPGGFA